ncbi:M14 family metallopeptidase [uncultured Megasphaera sp.]|uniref:M14 family metallopeptidase n=1 Tax=uncultured Megasphaera sp. TaxID=165188 RepID=UPI00265B6E5B|nr:M14 family metallopeptidase [uncultured Megasphaera sp.]
MKETIIYQLESLYRSDLHIRAYEFGGSSGKSICIIGSLRGNEVQQMYICSLLVKKLKQYEEKKRIRDDVRITVIPCANTYSLNQEKRFWPQDDTDINRMFPGYYEGETTQRIAEGIFDAIKDYDYGVQFTSSYIPGEFSNHIRVMRTGSEDLENSRFFGLPYIVVRDPRPYDTTTLNYNWQIWKCKAFSLYTKACDTVDVVSAKEARNSVLRFLYEKGFVDQPVPGGYQSQVIEEQQLTPVVCQHAGFLKHVVQIDDEVRQGEVVAKIYDPYDHSVMEELKAPCDGCVFFMHGKDLVYAHTAVIQLMAQ